LNNLHVFPDSGAMAEALALRVKEGVERAVSENRLYSIVLSGGETASNVYRQFAERGFSKQPWESIHLFWTDERCVPPESGESNFGIAYHSFLKFISIPEKNIHRMRGEADPDIESIRYAREVQEHLALRSNSKNFFDLVFLGIGTDGHTASLFPGQEEIMKTPSLCQMARHPETGQKRITLTPTAIKRSGCIIYHVIGQKKSKIVSELVLESTQIKNYPAAHIPGELYLDEAAASNLGSSG
jgi:6-phosphogluconolactonase